VGVTSRIPHLHGRHLGKGTRGRRTIATDLRGVSKVAKCKVLNRFSSQKRFSEAEKKIYHDSLRQDEGGVASIDTRTITLPSKENP